MTHVNSLESYLSEVKRIRLQENWGTNTAIWFRGESGNDVALLPKIAKFNAKQENYLLQSFRRQAGVLAHSPERIATDIWLFWAQHFGLPTRLLDWTSHALLALYFAINQYSPNPRVYMLNPHKLNDKAIGPHGSDGINWPLSWHGVGYRNIALAWESRNVMGKDGVPKYVADLPMAIPATYHDIRMFAQRSCFTVHGTKLESMLTMRGANDVYCNVDIKDCIVEIPIKVTGTDKTELERDLKPILEDLALCGVTQSTIMPSVDTLAKDILNELIASIKT